MDCFIFMDVRMLESSVGSFHIVESIPERGIGGWIDTK